LIGLLQDELPAQRLRQAARETGLPDADRPSITMNFCGTALNLGLFSSRERKFRLPQPWTSDRPHAMSRNRQAGQYRREDTVRSFAQTPRDAAPSDRVRRRRAVIQRGPGRSRATQRSCRGAPWRLRRPATPRAARARQPVSSPAAAFTNSADPAGPSARSDTAASAIRDALRAAPPAHRRPREHARELVQVAADRDVRRAPDGRIVNRAPLRRGVCAGAAARCGGSPSRTRRRPAHPEDALEPGHALLLGKDCTSVHHCASSDPRRRLRPQQQEVVRARKRGCCRILKDLTPLRRLNRGCR